MKKQVGFTNGKADERKPYVGEWVVIYPSGLGRVFCGQIKEIDGFYANLNPFYGFSYENKCGKIIQRKVLNEGSSGLRVPLLNAVIEPTTKSCLDAWVISENDRIDKEKNEPSRV